MPSSLIFAALAGAWLAVLVPMAAKRRKEVTYTADSALAARVLPRPHHSRAAGQRSQEMSMTSVGITPPEPPAEGRRYRAGRGGYDPENAAQLARAKYVFRQRVVLSLVIGSLATLVLAFAMSALLWWVHAAVDISVVAYLGYLRRQVRIEEEVRQRRAARLSGSRVRPPAPDVLPETATDLAHDDEEDIQTSPGWPAAEAASVHPRAVALDSDDGDPIFDELQPAFEPRYRRAVGE
ncbi:MAG TPA: gephyrin-like molybdotransferase receptor GlpR [Pseudonocardiaceae bacterium]|nr:gephyrin-like molybdotransferase receptor GlpR [Pseudonocardiaceae bacterium]